MTVHNLSDERSFRNSLIRILADHVLTKAQRAMLMVFNAAKELSEEDLDGHMLASMQKLESTKLISRVGVGRDRWQITREGELVASLLSERTK